VITWGQVAGSLVLVGVAVALSAWRRLPLERDIGWAVLRAFVQLLALGYVVKAIFDAGRVAYAIPVLVVMVVFGALTARNRAPGVPHGFSILVLSIGVALTATLGLALAVGTIDATSRTLIPIGGMVVGQAMVASALALSRLEFEIRTERREIEARLSLGATSRQAVDPILRRSLTTGMLNTVDSTKTAGIVAIPGTTVGMLLAGAAPLDAIRLQLVLFYLLIGGTAITVVLATSIAAGGFFTSAHQLREPTVAGSRRLGLSR
jgi:putative ABC transport system permease protein